MSAKGPDPKSIAGNVMVNTKGRDLKYLQLWKYALKKIRVWQTEMLYKPVVKLCKTQYSKIKRHDVSCIHHISSSSSPQCTWQRWVFNLTSPQLAESQRLRSAQWHLWDSWNRTYMALILELHGIPLYNPRCKSLNYILWQLHTIIN